MSEQWLYFSSVTLFSLDTAGLEHVPSDNTIYNSTCVGHLPGGDIPSASIAELIVLAVNIPP